MPRPLRTALCTLNRIIQRLNADSTSIVVTPTSAQTTQINTESANFRAEMVDCIYKASDLITHGANNSFVPYVHTMTLKGYEYRSKWCYDSTIGAYILRLPDRLLSVTSLTFAGTALDTDDYYLRPVDYPPYREIALYSGTSFTLPSASTESIALVGIWGYHPAPSAMWANSGATTNENPFSSSDTTLTVSSAANLEILQYIRIESEYLLITAISGTSVTVVRGVNGTTAAAHATGTQIDTYEPIEDVADECARLAIRRYQLRSGIEVVATGETAFELKMGDVNLSPAYRQYYVGSG
jgi:hypothetical protein